MLWIIFWRLMPSPLKKPVNCLKEKIFVTFKNYNLPVNPFRQIISIPTPRQPELENSEGDEWNDDDRRERDQGQGRQSPDRRRDECSEWPRQQKLWQLLDLFNFFFFNSVTAVTAVTDWTLKKIDSFHKCLLKIQGAGPGGFGTFSWKRVL